MIIVVGCVQGATGGGRSVREEVDMMIADLQLMDKKKIQSQRLSGGMKRKLRYTHAHQDTCILTCKRTHTHS